MSRRKFHWRPLLDVKSVKRESEPICGSAGTPGRHGVYGAIMARWQEKAADPDLPPSVTLRRKPPAELVANLYRTRALRPPLLLLRRLLPAAGTIFPGSVPVGCCQHRRACYGGPEGSLASLEREWSLATLERVAGKLARTPGIKNFR
jgi:hypothetical protein